jgi:hypothetical protein
MLDAKERSLRISVQSVESNLDGRINEVLGSIDNVSNTIDRTRYR